MDEKKKDEETNSSSLIPEQSWLTLIELISSQLSDEESLQDRLSKLKESLSQRTAPSAASEEILIPLSSMYRNAWVPMAASNEMRHHWVLPVRPLSSQLSDEESLEDRLSKLKESLSQRTAPSAASEEMVSPPSKPLAPSVPVKSESSMSEPPDSHLQKTQSEPLRETDSTVSHVSMKSDSSMYEPLCFNHKRTQSQLTEDSSSCSVCEEAVKDPVRLLCGHRSCKQCVRSFWDRYGSTADYPCKKCARRSERDQDLQSVLLEKTIKRVEMETEKLQAEKEKLQAEKEKSQVEKEKLQAEKEKSQAEKEKLQAEKEKSQAEKEKAQAEKEKSQAEKEKAQAEKEKLQAEKEKSQAEKEKSQAEKEKSQAEKEKLQAEKEKSQAEKEKSQAEKEKLQAEKEKSQAEKEKSQAEKEKSQAEKEKSQAEKEKLQAEKEKLQAEKEKLQAEKEKFELEKMKLALEIQLLEQRGKHTNYDHGVLIPNKGIPYIPYI